MVVQICDPCSKKKAFYVCFVGISCRISYSIVTIITCSYLFASCSGSITSVGGASAIFSAIVYM